MDRKGDKMTIETFLEKAKRFDVQAYKKSPDHILNYVPFTGAPQRHPHDKDRIVLIGDPFSTQAFYYEFKIADIEGIEKLPSLVTLDGESVAMVRVWVRKGSIGVKSMPFVVESIPGSKT
jgi:inorganic pyrophosphatase